MRRTINIKCGVEQGPLVAQRGRNQQGVLILMKNVFTISGRQFTFAKLHAVTVPIEKCISDCLFLHT